MSMIKIWKNQKEIRIRYRIGKNQIIIATWRKKNWKTSYIKNGKIKKIEIIKNNHEEKMKNMEVEEKEREDQRNIESMNDMAGLQSKLLC